MPPFTVPTKTMSAEFGLGTIALIAPATGLGPGIPSVFSLNSAMSLPSRALGASSARSLPSFASTVSSRANPAARSSWAMNG